MLAGAVHADRVPLAAGAQVVGVGVRVQRVRRRRLQRRLVQPGQRQDLPDGVEVERLAGVARRRERQQPAVERQPGAEHAERLDRLVGRPGEDHGARVTDRPDHLAGRIDTDRDTPMTALHEP